MTSTTRIKQLHAALKAKGVKMTTSGKRGIAVDGKTVAIVYDGANGALRVFVSDKRALPAKLAKSFTKTQTRGYATLVKPDDKLDVVVEAIAFAAKTPPAKASKTTSADA